MSQHPPAPYFARTATNVNTFYRSKIDSMREEIQQMRQTLNALLEEGASITRAKTNAEPAQPKEPDVASGETASPAGTALSAAREDNTHMAMTRENSLEPGTNGDAVANGSVTVEEPMGSLYEVTRLRNIRSNQAKTARPISDDTGEVNDFISRGVISEVEATELYRR